MFHRSPLPSFNSFLKFFQEHLVLGPLVLFATFRQDWLLTDSTLNDPWTQFNTFRTFGDLNPWAVESYKSARVMLVLSGQTLFALFGTYWGQLTLALASLLLLYCSLRFLSRALLGVAHPLVVGVGLYFPGFHGSGGWMYQNVLGIPLLLFGLGVAVRISKTPNERLSDSQHLWLTQGAIVCSLVYSQYAFVVPVASWSLVSLFLQKRRGAPSQRQLLRTILSCTIGVTSTFMVHEVVSLIVGTRSPAIAHLVSAGAVAVSPDQLATFINPFRDWIGSAVNLAPSALFLVVFLVVSISSRKTQSKAPWPPVLKFVAIFGLAGSIALLIGHLLKLVLLNYYFYSVGLVAPLLILGAAAIVELWQRDYSVRNRGGRFTQIDALLLGVGWILGWQLTSWRAMQNSLLVAASLWTVVTLLLLFRARLVRWGGIFVTVSAFALLGLGTSGPEYQFKACEQRESDFAVVDFLTRLGTTMELEKTTYLFDADKQTSPCRPRLKYIIQSAVGEHIYPFSTSESLSQTVQMRPLGSSLIIASTPELAQSVITESQNHLERQFVTVDLTVDVTTELTIVRIEHLPESLTRLRLVLEDRVGAKVEAELERIVSSETFQAAEALYLGPSQQDLSILVTQDSEVFQSLYPNASTLSLQIAGHSGNIVRSKVCDELSNGRIKTILVGPGVEMAAGKKELESLKKHVRYCLTQSGFEYVESPSNSESPIIFRIT